MIAVAGAFLAVVVVALLTTKPQALAEHQRCRCCGVGKIEHVTICAECFDSALVETEET